MSDRPSVTAGPPGRRVAFPAVPSAAHRGEAVGAAAVSTKSARGRPASGQHRVVLPSAGIRRPADGSTGLGRGIYRPGHTPVHAVPAHCKLLAVFGFVLIVVATPREAVWAFGLYAALLAAVAGAARVPAGFLLKRMLIEVPFLAFALLLPFIAEGPRTAAWLGLSLSEPGLWSAWNVLAKGSLGVAASVLLAATTEIRQLLLGLQRLRLPPLLVQIASFMVRYADVISGELRRMRIARESRGFTARGPRHWGVLAKTAGALFIRCYERGERVHLAMLSRGYTGTVPVIDRLTASRAQWVHAAALPAAALVVCVLGWTL